MMEVLASCRLFLLFFIIGCGPGTVTAFKQDAFGMKMLNELKTISKELSMLNGEATGNELKTTGDVKPNEENLSPAEKCAKHNDYSYLPRSSICVRFTKHAKATWSEARKICAADGGDLVRVDTKQKYDCLYVHLISAGKVRFDALGVFNSRPWIGLQTSKKESKWVDGSPMTFSRLKKKNTSSRPKCTQMGQGFLKLWFLKNCDAKAEISVCEVVV